MLKGNRVALRAVEENDLEQLMHWRNNPEFRKYFREFRELNMTMQKDWFDTIVNKDKRTRMFAITNADFGELLGCCGLCYIDWVNRNCDFSIYIGHDNLYIDDTFAVEAGQLMTNYAFDVMNMHRLWAEIYSFDDKKKTFFTTLGFSLDGTHRETYHYEGSWHNSLFYSLLASDPRPT